MSEAGRTSTGYSWLGDGLLPGQSALLETLWVYPWVSLALASNPPTSDLRFPLPVLLALVAVPATAGRWLESRTGLPRLARRVLLLALCGCLFLLFIRTETLSGEPLTGWRWLLDVVAPWTSVEAANRLGLVLFGWFVAGPLLARGVWLALWEITSESASRWFFGGLAAFLGLLALTAAPGLAPAAYRTDRAWLGPLLAGYFVAGLGWLALVRLQHLERQTFRRSSNRVSLSWLVVFSTVSGTMLVLAALITALAESLRAVEELAIFAAEWTWRAAGLVWARLVDLVLLLLSLVPRASAAPARGRPAAPAQPPPPPLPLPRWHLPLPALPVEIPAALVFVLLVLALGAWLALSHRRWELDRAEDEERTSLWSWRLLLQQLRRIPRRSWEVLRSRSRRPPAAPEAAAAAQASPPGSVRALYRSALRWGETHGRARTPSETPAEYEPVLVTTVAGDLAGDLTSAYVRVRYGEVPESETEVRGLGERWERHLRAASGQRPEEPELPT